MKETIKIWLPGIVIGIILVIFVGLSIDFYEGIKIQKQDHAVLQQVVNFLNTSIKNNQATIPKK